MEKKIEKAQQVLQKENIDGWLLYDFRRTNPLACRFLEISENTLLTRRFFYWIPKTGNPVKIISTVENPLKSLRGDEKRFRSWQELEALLQEVLKDASTVCMEYSPFGAVPEISRVDAGTIDLVRKMGPKVVSSGDLLQELISVWDEDKWESAQKAAHILETIVNQTWEWIGSHLKSESKISEYDVQQFMLGKMHENQCQTSHPPICAVNAHSSDPHYDPTATNSALIKPGDWIMLDLWCKKNTPNACYADITRMGFAGLTPSKKQQEVFEIVKKAQSSALQFIKDRYQNQSPLFGFEVDQICREVIENSGYGKDFLHRTGHNIDEEDHGPGAHIDNLETHDTRRLFPGTCFSIEPGIYLKGEFGVRLEYDVFLHPRGEVIVIGGIQEQIHLID